MDVNDNAYFLEKRVVIKSIASRLAPTFFCRSDLHILPSKSRINSTTNTTPMMPDGP
jgi:hypothetical protein